MFTTILTGDAINLEALEKRTYQLSVRDNPYVAQPYCVHEVTPEGGLENGRYFRDYAPAHAHFMAKGLDVVRDAEGRFVSVGGES
tara:strand:+ start:187 stop:441 length:255 start_codon:yes stop_codon:yes gene_type:complete